MAFKERGSQVYMAMSGYDEGFTGRKDIPTHNFSRTLVSGRSPLNLNSSGENKPSCQIGNGYWGLPTWSKNPSIAGYMALNGANDAGYFVAFQGSNWNSNRDVWCENFNLSNSSFSYMVGNEHTWVDGRGAMDDSYNGNTTKSRYWMYTYGYVTNYNRMKVQFENITFINWQTVQEASDRYRNMLFYSTANLVFFLNCRFINTEITSNYYDTNAALQGYSMSFYNCLFVNTQQTATHIQDLRHCTLINSDIGSRYAGDPRTGNRSTSRIYDNYFDVNSRFNCSTDSWYNLLYDFKSNIIKGRIRVRRYAGNTADVQLTPTGRTWADSLTAHGWATGGEIEYDLRTSNSADDYHKQAFLQEPSHFRQFYSPYNDGIHEAIYQPSLVEDSNANIFNMKDSHLGSTNNNKFISSIIYSGGEHNQAISGQTCIDYTLKTGSTQTLNFFKTGSTDGFPIGCYGVANSFNAADTNIFPTNQYSGVTTANTYDWHCTGATTGYVESNVVDMGEIQYIKINKHEVPELGYGPIGYKNLSEATQYQNYSILPMQTATVSYDIPTDVITNGDFTTAAGGGSGFSGASGWHVHTSTSGNTKGYQGWQWLDNAWCLTASSYTTGSSDPLYQGYSILSQAGCFQANKRYLVRVWFDHDRKLADADTAGYKEYGLTDGDIYFHDQQTTNLSNNVVGKIAPESYGYLRQKYTSAANRGAKYPCFQFSVSGMTTLAIQQAYSRRERITKIEAFNITKTGGTNTNHTLQIKYGDTEVACNAASYKTFLYNRWLAQDGGNNTNGADAFEPGYNISKISARFVKLKVWFNNNFKHL